MNAFTLGSTSSMRTTRLVRKVAADVDMWWRLVAAELESGVIDETGGYVGGEIDWKRKMDGYRDWMRRHPASRAVWETARYGAPLLRN